MYTDPLDVYADARLDIYLASRVTSRFGHLMGHGLQAIAVRVPI